VKVTLVSYINTFPFLDALKKDASYELDLQIPSKCGNAFIHGSADIALVPVGLLPSLHVPYKVLSGFCIGGDGPVHTVKLLSNVPLQDIDEIFLDNHSVSSRNLCKVLVDKYWYKSLNYRNIDINDITSDKSVLLIGDKVFEFENNYKYHYDLSEEWKKFTGLPFVFAVWISKPELSAESIEKFEESLGEGVENLDNICRKYQSQFPQYDLETYLKKHIKYRMDGRYKSGLELFLGYMSEERLEPV